MLSVPGAAALISLLAQSWSSGGEQEAPVCTGAGPASPVRDDAPGPLRHSESPFGWPPAGPFPSVPLRVLPAGMPGADKRCLCWMRGGCGCPGPAGFALQRWQLLVSVPETPRGRAFGNVLCFGSRAGSWHGMTSMCSALWHPPGAGAELPSCQLGLPSIPGRCCSQGAAAVLYQHRLAGHVGVLIS